MARSSALVRRAAYGAYGVVGSRLAGAVVRNAPRIYNALKNSAKSKGKQAQSSSSIISNQYDVGSRYRRQRMPARKRRVWKRFTRRVKHVMLQMQAGSTFTSDNYQRLISVAANTQVTFGQMLGGVGATDNDELLAIFKSAYNPALSVTSTDKYKLFVKSMVLDLQIKNTGSSSVIIDVYEVVCRQSDVTTNRIETTFNNAFAEQQGALIGSVSATNPAVTPFQNPLFLSMWRVNSKKEILLGAGSTTTMQMRLPYNRMIYGKKLENNVQALPGITKAYLCQVRGTPENNAGSPRLSAGEIVVCGQTTVTYGIPPGETAATTGQI